MRRPRPYDPGMAFEWGAGADWVTGLSTVALAAVTAWGLHTQRQDIKRQQRELRDQQEQLNEQRELTRRQTELITSQLHAARRAQAQRVRAEAQVAAWSTTREDDQVHDGGYVIRVLNGSDRPIYNVTCELALGTGANGREHHVPPVFAGHQKATGVGRLVVPILDPDRRPTRVHPVLRPDDAMLAFPFNEAPTGGPCHVVTFTDDADVRWQLDAQDRLTEIPPQQVVTQRGATEGG